jgi:hypothetical protein
MNEKHVKARTNDKTHRYENNERTYRVEITRDSETDQQLPENLK